MILSSCFLVLQKSIWRDPRSCLLIFSSNRSRLDEIKDLVFLFSCPTEVDLPRSKILSSCLLVLQKSTCRDPRSCLLVFSSYRSRLAEIQDLVFLSFRLTEVDLPRSRILSFCLFVLQKSTWRDPGSHLFVFSSYRSRLDEIQDLVFLSSWLFFLVFSSSQDLAFLSSRPTEVDLTRSKILSFCLLDSFSRLLVSSSRLHVLNYLVFWGHF